MYVSEDTRLDGFWFDGLGDEDVDLEYDETEVQPGIVPPAAAAALLAELKPLENVSLGEDGTQDPEDVLNPKILKKHFLNNFAPVDLTTARGVRRMWVFVKNPITWQKYRATYKLKGPISKDRQRKWRARTTYVPYEDIQRSAYARALDGNLMTLAEAVIVANAIARIKRKRRRTAHKRRIIGWTTIGVIAVAGVVTLLAVGVIGGTAAATAGGTAATGGAKAALDPGEAAKVAGEKAAEGATEAAVATGPSTTETLISTAGKAGTSLAPGETKKDEGIDWAKIFEYGAGAAAGGGAAAAFLPDLMRKDKDKETPIPGGYGYQAPAGAESFFSKNKYLIIGGIAVVVAIPLLMTMLKKR